MKILLLGAFLVAIVFSERVTYQGYQVFEVSGVSEEGLAYIQQLEAEQKALLSSSIHRDGTPAQIAVPPDMLQEVKRKLVALGMSYTVTDYNLGLKVEEERRRLSRRARMFDLDDFNDLDTIEEQLSWWELNCVFTSLTCSYKTIGYSYEGREIKEFMVQAASSSMPKEVVYLDSTIHAREWLAPATNLKILDHLLTHYGTDPTVTRLVNDYDWAFVIMVNPDGYAYSWNQERYWRKNRSPSPGSTCKGVDLNRNFAFNWGMDGTISTFPCSDLYIGNSPGSEPETHYIQEELKYLHRTHGVLALVSFHSYGRYWMFPWGHTVNFEGRKCERALDHVDMSRVAEATANAIENTYGTRWARGTSCETIYPTTGATDDYGKGVVGIKYTFNPELRGRDFVISKDEIDKSFREIWNGLVAMVDEIEIVEGRK